MTTVYNFINKRFTTKLSSLAVVLICLISFVTVGCSSDKSQESEVQYVTEGYSGYVSYHSKINMRSGPSKSSSIITTLNPGDHVMVYASNQPNDYWLYIKAPNGQSGYVSHKLLTYSKSDEIKKAVTLPSTTSSSYSSSSSSSTSSSGYNTTPYSGGSSHGWKYIRNPFKESVPVFCSYSAKAYTSLLQMSLTNMLLVMLITYLVEFGWIFGLKYYYTETYRPNPIWIWITLVISLVLTIPTIILFFFIGESAQEYTVYTLLLLSTACLMLHAAWRLKQYGMDNGIRENEHYNYYDWGLFLGEVLWLAVLAPIVGMWWDIIWDTNVYFLPFENGWISTLIGCVIAFFAPIAVCIGSMYVCGFLFPIANQSIYYIVTTVLSVGVMIMVLRSFWAHYSHSVWLEKNASIV